MAVNVKLIRTRISEGRSWRWPRKRKSLIFTPRSRRNGKDFPLRRDNSHSPVISEKLESRQSSQNAFKKHKIAVELLNLRGPSAPKLEHFDE